MMIPLAGNWFRWVPFLPKTSALLSERRLQLKHFAPNRNCLIYRAMALNGTSAAFSTGWFAGRSAAEYCLED